MSSLELIKAAVQRLSPEERAIFRNWFAEFDANAWDRQLQSDVATGKLDWLIAEARADYQAGRYSDR